MAKTALILGGGGLVGMAYHAGALKALNDAGLDLAGADVMIGTSAGAIIGSYLGSGWNGSDFYEYAHGRHRDVRKDPDDQQEVVRQLFVPLWETPMQRAQRSIGSLFAIASSRGFWRGGKQGRIPHEALRRAFPAGMYSTERTRERLHEDLPAEWPRENLFICAADLYSGKLAPFGRKGAPVAPFPDAVLASTAIPGLFPPVRIGDRQYVDGGIVSATSLNLAVEEGCTFILCVAPLGYRGEGGFFAADPRIWPAMASRQLFARTLRREVRVAREKGCEVLVIRPWLDELAALGMNAMRQFDRSAITDASFEGARRVLDDNRDHPVIEAFKRSKKEEKIG
jgi:NTE family protein